MLGKLLDTNIVVDALTDRPAHKKFEGFASSFKNKELAIEDRVNRELVILATASINILSDIIENHIVSSNWDELIDSPKKREEIFRGIESDIEDSSIAEGRNVKDIVSSLFTLFKEQYRDGTEKEIIQFCRHNAKTLSDEQARIIESRFTIYQSEKFAEEYNTYQEALTDFNKQHRIFNVSEERDHKDFVVFRNLIILAKLGGYNVNNQNLKIFFDEIKFYSRDPKFCEKINTFKEKLKANAGTEVQGSINKILEQFEPISPYEVRSS